MMSLVKKNLEVGSSSKFPAFTKEKLRFDECSMVFFIGSGWFGLDTQSLSSVRAKKMSPFHLY